VVRRGPHWQPRYGVQDGGGNGVVVEVKGWAAASTRDAVRVRWEATGFENIYRHGAALRSGERAYDVAVVLPASV
jgi:hypothetical protein